MPKPKFKEKPQWLHTPSPSKKLLEQKVIGKSWEGPSKTEGQGANITVSTDDKEYGG